jgi:uroporphyrinogen-III synthase/uroporphyrinogen III methyltransferase/synthase
MSRVLVTRPRPSEALLGALTAAGIESFHVPTIAVGPGDRERLAAELRSREDGEWIVVTSANGAAAVLEALGGGGAGPGGRVLAIGPATARVLRAGGVRVDAVPDRHLTAAIPGEMGDVVGRRVLLARGNLATPRLARELRKRGAEVIEVVAYHTLEAPPESRAPLMKALDAGLDGVLFASGSAVRGLLRLLPNDRRGAARRVPAFAIGPETTAAAVAAGFAVVAQAGEHTATGLAQITIQHLAGEQA